MLDSHSTLRLSCCKVAGSKSQRASAARASQHNAQLAALDAGDSDEREYDRDDDDDPWKKQREGNDTEIEEADDDDAIAAIEDDDDEESDNESADMVGGAADEGIVVSTVPAKKVHTLCHVYHLLLLC